mmetsp:Transcript_10722/g.29062  ORF Transcript_10722/g.29062 Transcript_10722/m.29062 type:complete len:213 (+) Transcript_10722:238-876(+)
MTCSHHCCATAAYRCALLSSSCPWESSSSSPGRALPSQGVLSSPCAGGSARATLPAQHAQHQCISGLWAQSSLSSPHSQRLYRRARLTWRPQEPARDQRAVVKIHEHPNDSRLGRARRIRAMTQHRLVGSKAKAVPRLERVRWPRNASASSAPRIRSVSPLFACSSLPLAAASRWPALLVLTTSCTHPQTRLIGAASVRSRTARVRKNGALA